MSERPEATTHADTFQRHEQSSENWQEAQAVTGRPNDTPIDDPQPAPLGGNSTLGSRARARQKASTKQVVEDGAEDKAVTSAATKSTRAKKK